jgi:hypothetical protein
MEIFVDFGLFEFLAALGLAAAARAAYRRRWLGILLLALSVLAPALLLAVSRGELARWLAAACLATALVNAGLIGTLMRRHDFGQLLARQQRGLGEQP